MGFTPGTHISVNGIPCESAGTFAETGPPSHQGHGPQGAGGHPNRSLGLTGMLFDSLYYMVLPLLRKDLGNAYLGWDADILFTVETGDKSQVIC